MITNIEMDTMRAIVAFSKEYRRQVSFVKITGNFDSITEVQPPQIELMVRLSDIQGIYEYDGVVYVDFKSYGNSFLITKKEYEEKLQKHINLAV